MKLSKRTWDFRHGETEVENELDIANCLYRNFQNLSLYNGQYVSTPNISRIAVREKLSFKQLH